MLEFLAVPIATDDEYQLDIVLPELKPRPLTVKFELSRIAASTPAIAM
jgi:hypothetical protein